MSRGDFRVVTASNGQEALHVARHELFRSIVAPLRHLTTASQAIAEGDLSARAPAQGRNEIAQLADAGQLYLHTAPLDLGPFLQEMVETHRIQAQERGVDLALETPSSFPLVEADRDRLAQMMGNPLSNALWYVPRGGYVTVRATVQGPVLPVPSGAERSEAEGQEVTVAVADDEPGVPPEGLPHLFERFWRGDRARRTYLG